MAELIHLVWKLVVVSADDKLLPHASNKTHFDPPPPTLIFVKNFGLLSFFSKALAAIP